MLLYEELVDYLIVNNYHHRYNLINGLGEVLKGAWGTETKNCLASRFIVPLRAMLVTKELVKTNDGVYKRLDSDVKFVECTKDSDLHKLYDICKTVYGDNLTVEDENACWVNLTWGRYYFDSDFEER